MSQRPGVRSQGTLLSNSLGVRTELIDAFDQWLDRTERAAPDGLVGDQRKEAFDLVKPRTVGGNEMHVPAGMGCQPRLDLRMLVATVVVDDAVHVKVGRHCLVDFTQERQELLMPMTRLAGGEHCAIEYVQGGEQ